MTTEITMDSKGTAAFNLNGYVHVRLNDVGRRIYEEHVRDIGLRIDKPDVADELHRSFASDKHEGYHKFTGWQLMNIFGDQMVPFSATPFDMNVYLEPL